MLRTPRQHRFSRVHRRRRRNPESLGPEAPCRWEVSCRYTSARASAVPEPRRSQLLDLIRNTWLEVEGPSTGRHPGTSIAPRIAASTKPRLRGLDSINPSFGSFGSSTGVARHRCAGGSLGALRPRLSTGLPLSRPSRGGVRSCRSVVGSNKAQTWVCASLIRRVSAREVEGLGYPKMNSGWLSKTSRHMRAPPPDFPSVAEHRSRVAGPPPRTRLHSSSRETWRGWPWPPMTGRRPPES